LSNRREQSRKYYLANKEKILEYHKQYRENNKEECLKRTRKWRKENTEYCKEYGKQWRESNKGKIIRYIQKNRAVKSILDKQYRIKHKEELKKYGIEYRALHKNEIRQRGNRNSNKRYKDDLKFNLGCKVCIGVRTSLKGNKKGRRWEDLVGYTLNDLFNHLKKTMPEGYNWNDYLEGRLHLDHKVPISVFNYTKPEHIDFKRCWALDNLQFLPAKENIIKSNYLAKPFQASLKLEVCIADT